VTHGICCAKSWCACSMPVGRARPDLPPDAPTIVELATMNEDRQVLRLFGSQSDLGAHRRRAGVPRDRAQALRDGSPDGQGSRFSGRVRAVGIGQLQIRRESRTRRQLMASSQR